MTSLAISSFLSSGIGASPRGISLSLVILFSVIVGNGPHSSAIVEAKSYFTPLHRGYEFACVAENLKDSSTYYCDRNGQVRCLPGWSDPLNLCQTPLCEVNNRTCVNGNCSKPFTCDCEVGYWGQFCEKCVPLPGCVNGFCNRSLECICKPGWQGMTCDKPSCPDCVHGECIMPGMCACHPGWSGPNCTVCEPRLDCRFGQCVDEPFQCKCFSKYQGPSCDQPMCREGCHPEHGFCNLPEQCWCKPGWTGPNCTECVPSYGCDPEHGRCHDHPWECVCDEGYTGLDCSSLGNINGHWGHWGPWGECSTTCGAGTRQRTRSCNYPAPAGNGTYCSHDGSSCDDFGDCNMGACPSSAEGGQVPPPPPPPPPHPKFSDINISGLYDPEALESFANGANVEKRQIWSEWSPWSACSVSCGGGVRDRSRECLADDLAGCGNAASEEEGACNTQSCPFFSPAKK